MTKIFGDSGYPQLEKDFNDIEVEFLDIFIKKQKDYGPNNISKFGEHGVLIRVSDKVERLINLHKHMAGDKPTPSNESIEDSWRDIGIYAIIALLLRKGQWPK